MLWDSAIDFVTCFKCRKNVIGGPCVSIGAMYDIFRCKGIGIELTVKIRALSR